MNKGFSSRYYNKRDFACQCGCGFDDILPNVVFLADSVADFIGELPKIISGCRCPEHNKNEEGSPTSSHLTGLAVDFETIDSSKRYEMLRILYLFGIKRIGVSRGSIHVDRDKGKKQGVVWTY